jgi:NADH-quinone oxidoreductase subunit G
MTPSVCQGCATGCNIEIHHRDERVWRLIPRHNPEVNDYWMCDEGRFTYHTLRENRLAGPTVNGLPASWNKALDTAAFRLLDTLEGDRDRIGVVFSAQHSNEANFVLAKLTREHWQLSRFYMGGKEAEPDRADDILRDADVNPNRAGVIAILGTDPASAATLEEDLVAGQLDALLVLGHDVSLGHKALEAAGKLSAVVVIADRELGVTEYADVVLPSAAWAEVNGTVTNRKGMVQRMHAAIQPVGHAIPAWEAITRLAQACDAAIDYTHAKNVFKDMTGAVDAWKEAEWGSDARPVQLRWAHSRG